MVAIRAAADTHLGFLRHVNEDAYHCGRGVFAVADGLGGHVAGDVASATAIERIAAVDHGVFGALEEAQAVIEQAVRQANEAVISAGRADPATAGMATTLTAAALAGGTVALAHVGDSRAYLWRDGDLRQLTVDHTPAGEALAAGRISPEEAARHPERHMLNRVIGLEDEVAVDVPDPVRLQADDRLLLCSDGLTEVVTDDGVAALLAQHGDPAAACGALVGAALAGGGPDNVTVLVLGPAARTLSSDG